MLVVRTKCISWARVLGRGSEEGFMEEVGSEELFSVGIHAFLLRDSSRRETVLMH